jgi:hypothetical protein
MALNDLRSFLPRGRISCRPSLFPAKVLNFQLFSSTGMVRGSVCRWCVFPRDVQAAPNSYTGSGPFDLHRSKPSRKLRMKDGENPLAGRVGATPAVWGVTAGLGGLVWLGSLPPIISLPLTHPINLVLFGICVAIGLGFTAEIWLSRRPK